jgi:RNA polymerase sigma-70 factor (ECF subfamily)
MREEAAPIPDLQDLIRRCRDGDPSAFDALASRHYRRVYRLAYRMLGGREAAEDAAQEIFLKAWRGIRSYKGASGFVTWLHAIAIHHCLNASRRQTRDAARTRPLFEEEIEGDALEADESEIESWHERVALREAVRRLPEKVRMIIALHYFSDYSAKEIAEMLGQPLRTVYARLEHGRGLLAKELRSEER